MKKSGVWLPVSAWNLNELFATECISPLGFYNKRNYGNPVGRQPEPGESRDFLFLFKYDPGCDICLYIDRENLDEHFLLVDDSGFKYYKTIQFRRGNFLIRFGNERLYKLFTAGSMMMLEVKCEPKYRFKGTMKWDILQILKKPPEPHFLGHQLNLPLTNKPDGTFRQPYSDKAFNQVKGMVLGMIRGLVNAPQQDEIELALRLVKIKNLIAGTRTKLVVSGHVQKSWDSQILIELNNAECSFEGITGRNPPRVFEMIKLRLAAVGELHVLRANTLKEQDSEEYKALLHADIIELQNINTELRSLEQSSNITEIYVEFQQLKDLEKNAGYSAGKKRVYFKKNSEEFIRKSILKQQIEHWENLPSVIEKKFKLNTLSERIKGKAVGTTPYDTAIDDEFNKLSEYASELIRLSNTHFTECRNARLNCPSLKGLTIDLNKLTDHYIDSSGNICNFVLSLPEDITKQLSVHEKELLKAALNAVLASPSGLSYTISQHHVLELITRMGNAFTDAFPDQKNSKHIAVLRDYYRYKTKNEGAFSIPERFPVTQNIMAFAIKSGGHEQIEKFSIENNITHNWIASALWGGCTGFASLPKTFTDVIYDCGNEKLLDDIDDYLFTLNFDKF